MNVKKESTHLNFWNWFAVLYITQALFFLTLIPFNFNWPSTQRWLIWQFEFQDIVQNLLLFFPLGVVYQHTMRSTVWLAVLYGTLVSATVEIIQLLEIERTSSYNDIVMNALSTMLGALYYRYFVNLNTQKSRNFALVYMLIPLCWFIAMRSATQHFMAWLVLPLSLLGLCIYQKIWINKPFKWLSLCIWLMLLVSPFVYISRKIIIFSFFGLQVTPAIITILLTLPLCFVEKFSFFNAITDKLVSKLILLAFLFILVVNIIWYQSKTLPILWTVPAHLHWIDTEMSFLLLLFVLYSNYSHSS